MTRQEVKIVEFDDGSLVVGPFASPPVARRTDPETSHEAARKVKAETVARTKAAILTALAFLPPATDEDIVDHCQNLDPTMTPSGIRTRRNELAWETPPRVVFCGYGETRAGNRCRLWRLP